MRKFLGFVFVILLMPCLTQSQSLNIVPEPAHAEVKQGTFTITPSTKIITEASGVDNSVNFLNSYLKKYYGFEKQTRREKCN